MNSTDPQNTTVLVTGGSGFVAMHSITQLLGAGYRVRATLRSLERESAVRQTLNLPLELQERLAFTQADLTKDAGWTEAAAGCAYVLHVASPFPAALPKDENELIIPAREGALRVLRAAREAGVRRVVMTSSFAAVGYGYAPSERVYDETCWTNIEGLRDAPYVKSKTLAERAAWDFIAAEGRGLELAVINPVGIYGPVLGADFASSIQIIQRLLNGSVPGCPHLAMNIVDVRDVADLHIRAMTHPEAAGERFIAVAGPRMFMIEMSRLLRSRLGDKARLAPDFELPDFVVRLLGRFDPGVGQVARELGNHKNTSGDKARSVLGWQPRSKEDAILATAESLLRLGLAEPVKK